MKKIVRLTESDLVRLVKRVIKEDSEKRMIEEQLLQNIKSTFKKGINALMGNTGNKFWDAAKNAEVGKMEDGDSSNEKKFCLDGCEVLIRIYSDGRVVYENHEFGEKTKGKMVFNSDGSFIFQYDDGGKTKKYFPK